MCRNIKRLHHFEPPATEEEEKKAKARGEKREAQLRARYGGRTSARGG